MYTFRVLLLTVMCLVTVSNASLSQTQTERKVFVNGTFDLATAFSKDGLPRPNRLIPGDSPFDNFRLRIYSDAILHAKVTVLTEFLIDPSLAQNFEVFLRAYARLNAFTSKKADLSFQIGKIPTPFGNYAVRSYSERNSLIGAPLMYHYFSSLRANTLPGSNADLLKHRGEGQPAFFKAPAYTGGGPTAIPPANGLPMVYDPGWDIGIAAVGSVWRVEYTMAVMQGTLSSPRSKGGDNNEGKSFSGRVGFVPFIGCLVGVSYARGPYLDNVLAAAVRAKGYKDVENFEQKVVGFDGEFSYRQLKLYGEVAANAWESPNIKNATGTRIDLTNIGWYAEGKYTFLPGLYAAVRYSKITFGKIDDGTGSNKSQTWDDDVETWESGIGYRITEGVIGKFVNQAHRRKSLLGAKYENFWATQLSLAF